MEPVIATAVSQEAVPTTATELTERDLIRAATNSPTLATDQFKLGDCTFQIVDLSYDDYILFIAYIQPLIEVMVRKLMEKSTISVPGIEISADSFSMSNIVSTLGKTLPEMVQIICRQTDPDITVDEVKKLAKKPTVLGQIVVKQIKQNDIIKDFTDFFGQILGLMKATKSTSSKNVTP